MKNFSHQPAKPSPPQEELHRLFYYYGGNLYWRVVDSPKSRVRVGDRVGSRSGNGYWQVTIKQVTYKLHRLIYKWFMGVDATYDIEHLDNNKDNNNIWNLMDLHYSLNHDRVITRERGWTVRELSREEMNSYNRESYHRNKDKNNAKRREKRRRRKEMGDA